jgi:hypothetical protein
MRNAFAVAATSATPSTPHRLPAVEGYARWRTTAMMPQRTSCRARSPCRSGRVVGRYSPLCLIRTAILVRVVGGTEADPGAATEFCPWCGGLGLTESGGPEGNVVCGRLGRDSSVASGAGAGQGDRPADGLDKGVFPMIAPPLPAPAHLIVPSFVGIPVATTRVATSSSTEPRPSRLART